MCSIQTHCLINICMDTLEGSINSSNLGETKYDWENRHNTEFDLSCGNIKTWIYLVIHLKSNAFFLGQTINSRKEKRHNDEDYTKLFGYWNTVGEKHITLWFGISQEGPNCDKQVHKPLRKFLNCRTNPGSGSNECFILENYSLDQIIQTCNNLICQVHNKVFFEKTKELKLMHFQKEFCIKIKSAFEKYNKFLLNSKCRSGKNIMTYTHIVESNYKLSVVCCRLSSPNEGWVNDAKYFPSIKIIDFKNDNWEEELTFWMKQDDVNIVLLGTVQTIINRIDTLCNYKVDLIVLDEAHVGGKAEQFITVYDKLNSANNNESKLIELTGTADKLFSDFDTENSFVYSYWQEQLDVRKGLFEKPRPKMSVYFAKYDCEEYKKIFGNDPDAMGNIFTLKERKGKDSEFLYPSLPSLYAIKFYGPGKSSLSPKNRLFQGNYHMMAMKGVGECHAFKKIVDRYIPTLVVTGETDEDQESINKFCAREAQALILTCSANVLGMTCEYIDTVINCRGGESKEFWQQFSFRGGSGEHNWCVIDFDQKRALRVLYGSFCKACDTEPELVKYEMSDLVNAIDWLEGFIPLDQKRVEEILCSSYDDINFNLSNIASGLDISGINFFNFTLESDLTNVISEDQLNTNNNDANNKGCVAAKKIDKQKFKDCESQKIKTVKALFESIPLVMSYMIDMGIKCPTINSIIESQQYKDLMHDPYKIFEQVLDKNPKVKSSINEQLSFKYIKIKEELKISKSKTYGKYAVSSQTQKSIPLKLFDSMVDGCKDFTKTYMFGDPSGSHTSRLLERGVDSQNLTVWESCDSHRNRVKYIDNNVKVVGSHPNMKFTAILANPPYKDDSKAKNNKLWHKIVNQHLPLLAPGGDMCEVTPASVLSITGEGKKFLKLFSTLYNLVEIDYTADQYFTESVSICSWHLVNEPYQGKTKVITKEGEFEWDLRNGVPVFGDDVLKQDILLKIANSNHRHIPLKIGQEIATKDYVPDGKYEIYHSSKKIKLTNVVPTTGDMLKLIVPFSSTYKNGGIFISNGYVGMLNCWCPIASEEEGNRISKIFDIKIIQFYIDNYKKSAGFAAAIKNGEVPDIKDYNNLSEQFGFTEEEVKYLNRINVL